MPITPGAATVIGAAITAGTDLHKWGVDTISAATKVQVAQLSGQAANHANQMKKEYGKGISTEVSIENATTQWLRLQDTKNYSGRTGKYPVPQVIGPGQAGVFLHVHRDGTMGGSEAALVYRVGDSCDVFWGWDTPYSGKNTCYTEIREKDHWPNVGSWDFMQDLMEKAQEETSHQAYGNLTSYMGTGQFFGPLLIIRLEENQSGAAKKRQMATPYRVETEVSSGKRIHIHGTVHKAAHSFEVNLVTPKKDVALHLNPCFEGKNDNKGNGEDAEGKKKFFGRKAKPDAKHGFKDELVRNTFRNGKWDPNQESKLDQKYFIPKGEDVEITILCERDHYACEINGSMFFTYKHRIVPEEVSELEIIGDVDLHAVDFEDLNLESLAIED